MRVFVEQLLQEVFEEWVADEVEGRFFIAYFVFYCGKFLLLDEEGREPGNHLKDDIAKSPPIVGKADVVAFLKELRREVFWSSSNGIRPLDLADSAAQPKINKFDEALLINKDIFRFEAE